MAWNSRTQMLYTPQQCTSIEQTHVLIVGLGGVGAYVAEMLARAGLNKLTLVDADIIEESNLNRQLIALRSTLGRPKTEVLAERLKDINPEIQLHLMSTYLTPGDISSLLDSSPFDFVVDAIDTLSPKVTLMEETFKRHIPIVSSMGSGGKTNSELVKIADISESNYCKLARMCRKRLHKRGIVKGITVVYSPEVVSRDLIVREEDVNKASTVGTISYMPAIFGCHLAAYVLNTLTMQKE